MISSYSKYLRSRSRWSIFLRRLFLGPIVRGFSGRVLDIGAGIGEFLEYYGNAVGIDRDPVTAAFCRSKGLDCFAGVADALPFISDSFDGVLLNNVLEHLECPDEVFQEIRRVLRRNGIIQIELPGNKGFDYDATHVKHWDKDAVIAFLTKWNFTEIRTSYFPVPFRAAGDILVHNKLRVIARHAK